MSTDDSDAFADGAGDLVPDSLKRLRSCIGCGLILTEEMWQDTPCPNCHFRGKEGYVNMYTSASFTGMIAIFQPKRSWCAQWQRYHLSVQGMYALNNEGEVTKDIIARLESAQKPLPEWVEIAKKQMAKKENTV